MFLLSQHRSRKEKLHQIADVVFFCVKMVLLVGAKFVLIWCCFFVTMVLIATAKFLREREKEREREREREREKERERERR